MADHQEASITLPSDPASVPAARRYVADLLTEWGLPARAEAADTVRLIVSELATNAVQHTFGQSPTFTVEIVLERYEQLRVGVTDSHPRWPQRLPAAV
ncbi:ATP-binding protein, partial [Streptomyces lushanensis]|uniref:ATP-binding protein n=1 Tax=Streptomyces lushanensis TaxID=1434255 RepID=UPI0008301B14